MSFLGSVPLSSIFNFKLFFNHIVVLFIEYSFPILALLISYSYSFHFWYTSMVLPLLLISSSFGHHTVRPYKLKWSLEQRKGYCKGQAWETGSLCSETPNSRAGFKIFKGKIIKGKLGMRASGYVACFWLAGGKIREWWYRNLRHQPSDSNQSVVCACSQPKVTALYLSGSLVPMEELRKMHQIVMYSP